MRGFIFAPRVALGINLPSDELFLGHRKWPCMLTDAQMEKLLEPTACCPP